MGEETNIRVYGDSNNTETETEWDKRKKQILAEVAGAPASDNVVPGVENNLTLDQTVKEFDNNLDEEIDKRKREAEIRDLEKHTFSKDFTAISPSNQNGKENIEEIKDSKSKSKDSSVTTPKDDDRFNLSRELSSNFTEFDTQRFVIDIKKLKQRSDEEINAALEKNRRENELILEKQRVREASFDSAIKQAQKLGSQIEQLQHLQ